ncbi:MAG: class I SAM-dependent methyltransferase [Phycisphaerae bacterium]|nr:class I SAM-dependent methyltransferase [Phycisphaerae bacterium]
MNMDQARDTLGQHFGFIADDGNEVIRDLGLPADARVLDVGTGAGYFAILLALNGYRVLTGEPQSDNSLHAKQDWQGNARRVGVGHLINFRAFSADAMPFDSSTFDAVFFLGVLHHIDEAARTRTLTEAVRTTRPNGAICFFEPNQTGIVMAREHDPSHPDAADPSQYARDLDLSLRKRTLGFFDAFIFHKSGSDASR